MGLKPTVALTPINFVHKEINDILKQSRYMISEMNKGISWDSYPEGF